MKSLRQRIIAAQEELQLAASRIDRDFERHMSLDTDGDIRRAHNLHMDGLRDAWRILEEIGAAPADFEALLVLHKRSPKAFEAHMVHIRLELERKEEPAVEEKAA